MEQQFSSTTLAYWVQVAQQMGLEKLTAAFRFTPAELTTIAQALQH